MDVGHTRILQAKKEKGQGKKFTGEIPREGPGESLGVVRRRGRASTYRENTNMEVDSSISKVDF